MRSSHERRLSGLELRAEGRRLSGVVMRYGEVSPSHRERFEPGAIRLADAVHLDLHHDVERAVAWHPGGGLTLANGRDSLTMRAELPPIPAADRALVEVREGKVNGLSVEFRAERERMDGDVRVIESAILAGIGIVRVPSYGGSRVEARARSGRRMRARVPYRKKLTCDCIARSGSGSGGACVPLVRFQEEAGQAMADAIAEAVNEARRDVLAVHKDYSRPLGSARRGTLRARSGKDGLDIEVDIPTGEAGDSVVSASETAGVIARPLIDYDQSEFVDGPDGRTISKPFLRAILIGSTDARVGWPDAIIDYDGEDRAQPVPKPRRRAWL